MSYTIQKNSSAFERNGQWNGNFWASVPSLSIEHFHANSSAHHPRTDAKICYSDASLFLIFQVQDQFVRAVHTQVHDRVCEDSCVEFFVRPKPHKGYFNFEVNCGGTILARYNPPPTERKEGVPVKTKLATSWVEQISIYHSLPKCIDPEITQPTTWVVEYEIPFTLFEHFVGPIDQSKEAWKGNLYKCADKSSHPHWATWNPIGEELKFHNTEYFGTLEFE